MLEPQTETVTRNQPSPMPYYVIAGVWVVGTMFLRMYRLSSWIIMLAISVALWVAMKALKIFPDRQTTVQVDKPRSYASEVQQQSLQDGTASLKRILALAGQLGQPVLKQNVDALTATADKILDYLYQHADAAQPLRKLIYYYLPTVEKLLSSYLELARQPDAPNVTAAKGQIESIIATTAAAFAKQLDALYDSEHIDVSADAKVLEKLYEQQGLIEKPAPSESK